MNTIDHPPHYQASLDPSSDRTFEAISVIEAWGHGESFAIGNVLKYLCRYKKKGDPLEDLKKAKFYLDWVISLRQKETTPKGAVFRKPDHPVDINGREIID